MNFRSDNEAPVNPIIMQAIIDANQGYDESYGYDKYSEALTEEFKQLFGCWCEVIPLATGTAANSLAIALAAPPYGSAFCFHRSHLNADECGAPEFFSDGVKLIGIDGENGKIDLKDFKIKAEKYKNELGALMVTFPSTAGRYEETIH